jgi:hypothetical protein
MNPLRCGALLRILLQAMGIFLYRMFGRIESHATQAAELEISREISSRTGFFNRIFLPNNTIDLEILTLIQNVFIYSFIL